MSYLIDFRELGLKTVNFFLSINVDESRAAQCFTLVEAHFNAQLSSIGPMPGRFSQSALLIIDVNYRGGVRTTSRNPSLIATTRCVHFGLF